MITGPQCCVSRNDSITGYGTPNNIMFIGIAPGRDEATRTKRPLTGPSGKLLDATLLACGIERDDVYCTNLICYWQDAPSKEEIAVCNPRLLREILEVNPKVLVLLGALACETMLGMKLSKARGAVIKSHRAPLWTDNGYVMDGPLSPYILATYHPAAALHRDPDNPQIQIDAACDFAYDMQKLPLILNGHYTKNKPTYTLINSAEEANRVLADLKSPVSIDIETNFDKEYDLTHPFDSDISCIGVADNESHAYILTPDALTPELVFPTDKEYVPHYGTFDMVQIRRKLGVWLPISGDTYWKSSVYDERSGRGRHKLKPLSRQWCGADFYEEDSHSELNTPEFYQYNANDVCYTWRLDAFLEPLLREDNTSDFYKQILIPLENTLAHSQFQGIYVNPEVADELKATLGFEYLRVLSELRKLARDAHMDDFNPNSPQQIRKLFEFYGVQIISTAKAILDRLDHPLAQKIRRYRTLHRLIQVYLFDVLRQLKYDGHVHPSVFLTSTMRLIYIDPDMQTLPKPKTVKDLGVIRKLFTARSDDYILLEADYERIEGWVGAYLSEDDALLADLQSSDWHAATATGCFGKQQSECTPYEWAALRDAGKHINYGAMFEEGATGLTRQPPIGIGCDLRTAQQYLHAWYSRYHKFDEQRKRWKHDASTQGYIDTPWGFRRHFPLIVNDHQLRQAVNSPIQMTASGYTLSAAPKLEQALAPLDSYLMFIEHDGTYFHIARRHLEEAKHVIREIMEAPPLSNLPSVKITMEEGPNLAELV